MSSGERVNPCAVKAGTAIGPYEVVELVAVGGAGCLYKVLRSGRPYALKLGRERLGGLLPDDREHSRERFDREIAALASLRHPNIVRVHSFEFWPDLDGYPYLVLDFVEGSYVREWRAEDEPSLARICRVFEKIASALAHMHGLGIYHRDVKDANILVRADEEPVIVDFGIARPRVAHTLTRAATVGTVTHYAPEYAVYCDSADCQDGKPFEWKATVDLHALGYLLYEVLTGRSPFHASESEPENEIRILNAIKKMVPRRPSEWNPGVPQALDDLAMRLLEKDPARRPDGARAVEELLARARERGGKAWDEPFVVPEDVGAPPAVAPGQVLRAADAAHEELELVAETAVEAREAGAAPPPGAPAAGQGPPQQPPKPPAVGAFHPPTEARPLGFDAGEPGSPERPQPNTDDPLPSVVREVTAHIAASAPRRSPNPFLLGSGVVALALLLILVVGLRGGPPVEHARPLFSAGEGEALPPSAGPLALPSSEPAEPAVASPTERLMGAERRLAAEQASARPAPGTKGKPRLRASPAAPRLPFVTSSNDTNTPWMLRSTELNRASSPAVAAPKPRGVPFGAHMRAKLLTNLDSRTIGSGPVEAVLPSPVIVRGEIVLPAFTMIYGSASEGNGRFNVHFTRLRLPDDTEVAFKGLALARDDGKPGLAASRRIEGPAPKTEGLATKIAKGTGNILLDTITGSTKEDIARTAGQTALAHEEPVTGSSQSALLLDSGVIFDIWVEETF